MYILLTSIWYRMTATGRDIESDPSEKMSLNRGRRTCPRAYKYRTSVQASAHNVPRFACDPERTASSAISYAHTRRAYIFVFCLYIYIICRVGCAYTINSALGWVVRCPDGLAERTRHKTDIICHASRYRLVMGVHAWCSCTCTPNQASVGACWNRSCTAIYLLLFHVIVVIIGKQPRAREPDIVRQITRTHNTHTHSSQCCALWMELRRWCVLA